MPSNGDDDDVDSTIDFATDRTSTPEPEETFEDADWTFKISSEEVGYDNTIRHEVRWYGWKSEHDGTNTTYRSDWEPDNTEHEKTQQIRRREAAKSSSSISISGSRSIVAERTHLRKEAYHEKLALHKLDQTLNEKLKLLDASQKRGPVRQPAPTPASASRSRPIPRRTELANTSEDSDIDMTPVPSSSRPPKRVRQLSTTASSSPSTLAPPSKRSRPVSTASSSTLVSTSSSARKRNVANEDVIVIDDSDDELALPSRRTCQTLSLEWTAIAAKVGAASISVVNDEDESIPDVPEDFKYIERQYTYSKNIEKPPNDAGAWMHCRCMSCTSPGACDCQPDDSDSERWVIRNPRGNRRSFAYNSKKMFAFHFEREKCVVECNKFCDCGSDCPNRVAQLPRQTPIEIFKTEETGWGARASVDVEAGTVLGLYSGLLLKRAVANKHCNQAYSFNLDWLEEFNDEDEQHEIPKYTVDGYAHGNWTRFINHSCEPNLLAYSVVYDSIPDSNTPYIAFTARTNITARDELTFDYHPNVPKGKPWRDHPPNARPCMCGTSKCCRWIEVD